jgi:hypothetical protein
MFGRGTRVKFRLSAIVDESLDPNLPKDEAVRTRNPKSEIRKKAEIRNPKGMVDGLGARHDAFAAAFVISLSKVTKVWWCPN